MPVFAPQIYLDISGESPLAPYVHFAPDFRWTSEASVDLNEIGIDKIVVSQREMRALSLEEQTGFEKAARLSSVLVRVLGPVR
jgi:hypothetical protein